MNEQDYKEKYAEHIELLKSVLSKKRLTHSINVAHICYELAVKHNADTEKCYLAGLLHDIKKEETPHAMRSLAILSEMDISNEEICTPALWHAPAGAYYLSAHLAIHDSEMLNAVRYHTAGRANMSDVEKIVYLGDLTSEDRSYKDVEKYRKLSFDDLDAAMYLALKYSIGETLGKCGLLPPCTVAGYNYYAALYKSKKDGEERKNSKND